MSDRFRLGPEVAVIHENGEIVDLKPKPRRRGNATTEGLSFIMFDTAFSLEVLPLLNPTQVRIMTIILMDYREGEPWARLTAAEMCRELKIADSNLYRALKPLRESGIVIKRSTTTWQVSPLAGWRGSRAAWEKAVADAPDLDLSKLKGQR